MYVHTAAHANFSFGATYREVCPPPHDNERRSGGLPRGIFDYIDCFKYVFLKHFAICGLKNTQIYLCNKEIFGKKLPLTKKLFIDN